MSMLEPYVDKPEISPLEMANLIISAFYRECSQITKTESAKQCAIVHLRLREKDGLYLTLSNHWIKYWREVEEHIIKY